VQSLLSETVPGYITYPVGDQVGALITRRRPSCLASAFDQARGLGEGDDRVAVVREETSPPRKHFQDPITSGSSTSEKSKIPMCLGSATMPY
jgi:hypothetical protein